MLSARLRHTRHLFLLALLCAVALLAISATTNSSATNPLGTTTAAASSCPGDWTGYWTWNAQDLELVLDVGLGALRRRLLHLLTLRR